MSGPAAPAGGRPAYFDTGWTGGKNPWVIALVVTMATFMEVLDTSIANVSLPHIAGNLSVTQDQSTWVLTSYLVANAIVLPISGWIATKIGRKRFYMTCVTLFTIASFLCGIAPSLGVLVLCRVLQGLAGGGLGPSEQAILADTFPPAKRGMAFAVYGMAVVLAPAIGPTLGGFITEHYSWRWVFFINVPVGIASIILSNRVVTDPPHLAIERAKLGGVDYVGLVLITIGLGALEVVLDKGQEDDWFHSAFIVGFMITAAVAIAAFVYWEWHHEHPILDVKMFKERGFAVACIMMLMLGMALFGTTVLLPQYTQIMLGYTAERAGMAMSPGGLVVLALLPMVGILVSKRDPRWLIAFGFTVLSLSLFVMTHKLYDGIDFRTAVELRAFQSVGLAFLFVPINAISYAGVPVEKNNAVSGVVNLARNLGGDIGIALVTTIIVRRAQFHQTRLSDAAGVHAQLLPTRIDALARAFEHAGASQIEGTKQAMALVYRQLVRQATTLAYLDALYVLGVFALCVIPLLLLAKKPQTGPAPMAH